MSRSEEDDDARAIVKLADAMWWGPWLWHTPNGGRRKPIEAARFKGIGVRSGVSDYTLALPAHGYLGLYLELKSAGLTGKRGTLEDDQQEFLIRMASAGYYAVCAWGLDAATAALLWYAADATRPQRGTVVLASGEADRNQMPASMLTGWQGLTPEPRNLSIYRRPGFCVG